MYRWDAVNDNDLRAGLIAMFITVLVVIIGLMCYIVLTYDRDSVGPVGKPSTRRPESSRSSYTYDRSGGSGGGGYSEQYRN